MDLIGIIGIVEDKILISRIVVKKPDFFEFSRRLLLFLTHREPRTKEE
jgi:hypothetical protein